MGITGWLRNVHSLSESLDQTLQPPLSKRSPMQHRRSCKFAHASLTPERQACGNEHVINKAL
jgi:hypothetical protein